MHAATGPVTEPHTGAPRATATVGVVIPTFNRPDLLLLAVQSVLAQHPPPDQVIIVDDGGHQPAHETVQALAHSGAMRLLQEDHGGPSRARNRGAREIETDFVLFLDDDDCLLPGALRGLADALIAAPAAVAAAGGGRRFFVRNNHLGDAEWPPIATGGFDAVIAGNPFFTGAVLVRRSAFDAVGGFEETTPLIEDWDLWLKLARRGPILLPRVMALEYRVHPANMSRSSTVARLSMGLADHYLASFTPVERANYAPQLANYLARTFGAEVAWHVRVAFRQGRVADAFRDMWLLARIVWFAVGFAEGRQAIGLAWAELRKGR
ncbi:MAG TPA: glycosyltransferase family 2 protein [Gemmatimonadales bacterium]|jgi:glycosyltransferase involved in cell wall biosynthesis|nr:glycosyltransferase family 2 protein [Gemmatimonadales bacterium]